MEKKYQIHRVDAFIQKLDEVNGNVSIALCKQGVATKPHQRKEAEMLVRLLNWYNSIDKDQLSIQLDKLRVVTSEVTNNDVMHSLDAVGDMVSDLLIIGEDLEQLENTNHKDNIEKILINAWSNIGMDIPDNFEQIV